MSAAELQKYLLQEGVNNELILFSKALALADLSNVRASDGLAAGLKSVDWNRTLLAASILSRGLERESVEAALRIATAAVLFSEKTEIRDAGAVIFEKLSNRRAVMLGEEKGELEDGLSERLGVASRLQMAFRHIGNSVLVDSTGEWLPVNRFQHEFWTSAVSEKMWLSASAPTASGKTFIVLRWLLDKIASTSSRIAIYIAPTRALVSEIAVSLASMVRSEEHAHVEISELPLKSHFITEPQNPKKVIFVLTQERLHLLANSLGDEFTVDLLVVDEAHKVADRLRGVILQNAIERVTRANTNVVVVFVSPATENPAELLADAPVGRNRVSVDCDTPTVIQNVILARQAPSSAKVWNLALQHSDTELYLGEVTLAARPTTIRKRIAFLAASIAPTTGTLVYANGAAEAEDIAHLISQFIPESVVANNVDSELSALADLARKGVHKAYLLAPLVEAGVAFHYGNMPTLLRTEIERLFRLGKIRFLVCTSTLIEGVNLACRTIVVRGPRKGKSKPMQPHDFWNLAGRAGRWGAEFQGNIVCIDPDRSDAWPNGVPARARYPIVRETDTVLQSNEGLLEYINKRLNASPKELGAAKNEQFEQVSAYLLCEFVREGSILGAPFNKRHDRETIKRLNDAISIVASKISIPAELLERHPGVNAVGLQRLLEFFISKGEDKIDSLLPAHPENNDAYNRTVRIMEAVNQYIYPTFLPESLVPLHALVTNEWLRGLPLSAIIAARIKYHRKHRHEIRLAKLFRETMSLVEQTARYLAPKYIAAYMDVLDLYLKSIGREELIDRELSYGVMLEFGLSTKTMISLTELGFSRMTAVEMSGKIAKDNLNPIEVREWLVKYESSLESMDVPTLIIREVRARLEVLK